MTQKTRCPECGARLSVPDTGLTMTCDYCGCSQPVPDADKRRKKIEREENQQRQAEKTAQKAQVKIENHLLQKRKKRWNAVTGSITTIGGVLVCLIILGFILYKKGTLDVFFGDGGAQALEKIAKKLRQGGQKILTDKRHERFYYDFKRIEIKLEKDRCYT